MRMLMYSKEKNGIGIVRLNRPKEHHALNGELLEELKNLLDEIREDTELRGLILTSTGHKTFCAGADLKERLSMSESDTRQRVKELGEVFLDIENLTIPTVALLNGSAYGGGLELALSCDIRIGVEGANFALPETRLGIIPGAGGTQRLPRLIGIGRAKDLIYTGRTISAREAYNYGLIQYIVSSDELQEVGLEYMKALVENAPISLMSAKFSIQHGYDYPLEKGLSIEQVCYEQVLYTTDRKEGLNAFKEKRKPSYKGE